MEWWEEFFSGLWADVQRHHVGPRTAGEADGVERLLDLTPPARLLDVPCGDGRMAIELAGRGYSVVGVDRSAEMLEIGRRAAAVRGTQVDWRCQDMREGAGEGFDAALCLWGSFGYFDDAGNQRLLDTLVGCLRPGGRLLLDAKNVAEYVLPHFHEFDEWVVGDVHVHEQRRWDALTGRLEASWTFRRGEVTEQRHSSLRIYTVRELVRMLEGAGASRIVTCSDFEGTPFALGEPLVAVGRRA